MDDDIIDSIRSKRKKELAKSKKGKKQKVNPTDEEQDRPCSFVNSEEPEQAADLDHPSVPERSPPPPACPQVPPSPLQAMPFDRKGKGVALSSPEDAPFAPDWGIRVCDTVLGDKRAAEELVKYCAPAKDRAYLHQLSYDYLSQASCTALSQGVLYLGETVRRMNHLHADWETRAKGFRDEEARLRGELEKEKAEKAELKQRLESLEGKEAENAELRRKVESLEEKVGSLENRCQEKDAELSSQAARLLKEKEVAVKGAVQEYRNSRAYKLAINEANIEALDKGYDRCLKHVAIRYPEVNLDGLDYDTKDPAKIPVPGATESDEDDEEASPNQPEAPSPKQPEAPPKAAA